MILLDSSGWIEMAVDGPLASQFQKYLSNGDGWVASTINIFEVYKKFAATSQELAIEIISHIKKGLLIEVSEEISVEAADLALKYKLGLADSILLATATLHQVKLITADNDFRNLPGCVLVE